MTAQTAVSRPTQLRTGRSRACLECGSLFQPAKRSAEFCGTACRSVFNNRRAMRGATLYDVVMSLRHDRKLANSMEAWKIMCRMAMQFRDEDKDTRGGRKSWRDLRKALRDRPDLYATVIANDAGGAGTRRKWRT